ncbi:MAG: ABC transporter permease, partial [Cyanobacteria bacterium J06642_11]
MTYSDQAAPVIKKRVPVFWRLAEDIPPGLDTVLRVISVVVPFCLWWLIASLEIVNPKFLPGPVDVAQALWAFWQQGLLVEDTLASIFRVTTGFLLAAILSIPLGISMGAFA